MVTAARRSGRFGTAAGVATARFVASRGVVVGGTHVRISSNFGGRVETVNGVSDTIVSFTRGPTVWLARTRSRTPGLFGRGGGPEDIRLNQVIPATRPAHFYHVYRELLLRRGESDEFVGRPRRPGQRPELLAENPGDQRELLFSADRAHHVAATTMKFGRTQQVRIRITHCRDTRSTGVDLGQQ